jgi:hypothetical protein
VSNFCRLFLAASFDSLFPDDAAVDAAAGEAGALLVLTDVVLLLFNPNICAAASCYLDSAGDTCFFSGSDFLDAVFSSGCFFSSGLEILSTVLFC